MSGWSRPSCSRRACTTLSEAVGPRALRTGSPPDRRSTRKAAVTTTNIAITIRIIRLARKVSHLLPRAPKRVVAPVARINEAGAVIPLLCKSQGGYKQHAIGRDAELNVLPI